MKDDRVYLQHIQDALDDIVRYCSTDRDAFFTDRMRQDATGTVGNVWPGPNPSVYAFTKVATHRNIYRIPCRDCEPRLP